MTDEICTLLACRLSGCEVRSITSLGEYGEPFDVADRKRAVFYVRCKLIEDLTYGLGSPKARRYAEASFAHLARIFVDFA